VEHCLSTPRFPFGKPPYAVRFPFDFRSDHQAKFCARYEFVRSDVRWVWIYVKYGPDARCKWTLDELGPATRVVLPERRLVSSRYSRGRKPPPPEVMVLYTEVVGGDDVTSALFQPPHLLSASLVNELDLPRPPTHTLTAACAISSLPSSALFSPASMAGVGEEMANVSTQTTVLPIY
jgi:hypothetical protein